MLNRSADVDAWRGEDDDEQAPRQEGRTANAGRAAALLAIMLAGGGSAPAFAGSPTCSAYAVLRAAAISASAAATAPHHAVGADAPAGDPMHGTSPTFRVTGDRPAGVEPPRAEPVRGGPDARPFDPPMSDVFAVPSRPPAARLPRNNAAATRRPVPGTRVEAVEFAVRELVDVVRRAHRGELEPRDLRAERLGVERRLARTLAAMPADLRAGDGVRLDRAVARLNQIIIRSQEWEVFGPRPRPEWGWDPEREIRALESDDSVLDGGDVIVITSR